MADHDLRSSVDLERQDSIEVRTALAGPPSTVNPEHVKLSSASRIAPLDGLRGIAIIAVFIHHAFHVKLLWMGVDLFFVLSGFLITTILLRQKRNTFGAYISHFYARRARRILPPYLIILIIVTIIFGTAWMRYWYLYIGGMNFFFPLHLFTPPVLPLWSLAVEEQFYVVWPFAVYFLPKRYLHACAWGLIVLAPFLRYVCTPIVQRNWAIYMLTPFRMDTLAAGALIAILWPSIQTRLATSPNLKWKIGTACAGVIALAVAALSWYKNFGIFTYANTPLSNAVIFETTLVICVATILIALVGVGASFLSNWILVWIGRISYSIYLFHLTALHLWPGQKAIPASLLTLSFALVMWYAIEMPNPWLSLSRWRKPLVSSGEGLPGKSFHTS
jgi:peptidoglycan/LPS O-acetylase OafA/YrhL